MKTSSTHFTICTPPVTGASLGVSEGDLDAALSGSVAAIVFGELVPLIQFAKTQDDLTPVATFLEDLIDACVMECYFREHMAERDLLFHDDLAPHLAAYDPSASEAKQREFLTHLHNTLNAPSSKIRNHLLRLTADSPDLLAVIKEEGKV